MRTVYFITHPEVMVDANIPVPDWSLSERGLERMHLLLNQPWVSDITSIYSSTEKRRLMGRWLYPIISRYQASNSPT